MWSSALKNEKFVIKEIRGIEYLAVLFLIAYGVSFIWNFNFYVNLAMYTSFAFATVYVFFRRTVVTLDPDREAFNVRSGGLFKSRHQTFLFKELKKPFAAVNAAFLPKRPKLRIEAILCDGTVLELTSVDYFRDYETILEAVETMNRIAFGKHIEAIIQRPFK